MDYRMLELIAPPETAEEARKVVEDEDILGVWTDKIDNGCSVLRVLLDVDRTEALSDLLAEKFSNAEGFRIMLFAVEATLPQPDMEEEEENKKSTDEENGYIGRISREELYSDVSSGSEMDRVYLATTILSALVAGTGLLTGNVAVVIGAMVIAPLLEPNVAMALAVTLGDMDLGWRALKTNAGGLLAALAVAIVMGFIFQVDPETPQIITRTKVTFSDIIIATAAGSAGVLAFTRGIPATVIGVMVAIALLPALVSIGLLLGAGYNRLAVGAVILTTTNLVCINLAGVLTFLIQGIRPRRWWEAEKAKKATYLAIATWLFLLIILGAIIWLWA